MSLSNSQYDAIIRNYEKKQNRNRRHLEERINFVYQHVQGYQEIESSVASISVEHGKRLLAGEEDALPRLKSVLRELSGQKEQLLLSAGLSADYLSPSCDCPDCQDTGYIENTKCHCFRQAMISFLYEQSGIQELLQTENFSALSYDFYQGEDLERFRDVVTKCKHFIEFFDSDYHNLLFYGTVGTGKSFLSCCITKALIDCGHSVVYFSSVKFFEVLSRASDYRTRSDPDSNCDDLYTCDLLIIDDLGTELTNNFVTSHFFSCLNERNMAKKSTIISTNLSLEELRLHYSERIFSRITSNYTLCKLDGSDIRIKKRLQNRK